MRSIDAIEIILKEGIYQVRIYKEGYETEIHKFIMEDRKKVYNFVKEEMKFLTNK